MKTRVTLRNEIAEVQWLKKRLTEYGQSLQLADELIQDVNLALEEAVSNIIFYGYEDAQAHQIEVAIEVADDTLVLEITDDGKAFNLLDTPEPDLNVPFEEREIGGMGIYLIRTLMDDITYRTKQGKNILVMRKQIARSPSGNKNVP